MKKMISVLFTCIMMMALVGCSGNSKNHEGEAKTPSGSSIQKGKDYNEVIDEFKSKGFNNIKEEKIEDLITGWVTKDGEVKEVSVGGDVDYSADEWVSADIEVIIKYHTFKEKDTESVVEPAVKEEVKEEIKKEEDAKKAEEVKKEEEKNKIYTADNDEMVKEFLFGNPDLKDFYSKYSTKKIGFIAIVSNVKLIEGKNTRYEAVLQVVDGKNNTSGPFIKVKDFSFIGEDISALLLNPTDKQFDVVVTPRSYTTSDDIFFVDLKKADIKNQ